MSIQADHARKLAAAVALLAPAIIKANAKLDEPIAKLKAAFRELAFAAGEADGIMQDIDSTIQLLELDEREVTLALSAVGADLNHSSQVWGMVKAIDAAAKDYMDFECVAD